MGLGMYGVKLNLELWQRGYFKNKDSILDIGSQELHLAQKDFEDLLKQSGVSGYEKKNFSNLKNFPGKPGCSAKPFYELLGFKKYACIDMNENWGAIKHDLNASLEDKSLYNTYDVVTDYGCNEHAFNVSEAYRTMHRLCKPDGLMIINQAVFKGNGYFLFDVSFFEGIAAANNYKILYAAYTVTLKSLTEAGSDHQYLIPASQELVEAVDWTKVLTIGVCYVLQKQSEDDFKIPYQGRYMTEAYKHQGYELQFLPDYPPGRTYLPMQESILDRTRTKTLIRVVIRRILKRLGLGKK